MKKLAFILAIIGLSVLAYMMTSSPVKISSIQDMIDLKDHQKVFVTGKVIAERVVSSKNKILVLDNGLNVSCSCLDAPSYLNKNISVVGIINNFYRKNDIVALKIQK